MPSPAAPTTKASQRWNWALPRINASLQARKPRHLLLLCGALGALELPEQPGCQLTRVMADAVPGSTAVNCRLDELPFQSRVFDFAIAVAVLTDGEEAEFAELLRVLEPGAELLVLGDGWWSLPRRRDPALSDVPALRYTRLSRALRANSFVPGDYSGRGLAGFDVNTGTGWSKPLAAFSDMILLSACHRGNHPVSTSLRLVRTQVLKPRQAALDGLSRARSW